MIITGHNELQNFLNGNGDKKPGVVMGYAGFDPTATGLHLGHLSVLRLMKRVVSANHNVWAVIGSETGKVGDPTGRNSMRPIMTDEQVSQNKKGILADISTVLPSVEILENEWLSHFSLTDAMNIFMRHVPMRKLLSLGLIRDRLGEDGEGITLMEALYPLLQAIDMVFLAKRAQKLGADTFIQFGGQDQTGNIGLGIHLVSRMVPGIQAVGCISPLIVNKNGSKMGKSSGGALFIREELVDNKQFFDTLLSMDDDLIESAMAILTPDLDVKGLSVIDTKKAFAMDVMQFARGQSAVDKLLRANAGSLADLKQAKVSNTCDLPDIAVQLGMASSKSEARRLMNQNGIRFVHPDNGTQIRPHIEIIDGKPKINDFQFDRRFEVGEKVIVQKGKKQVVLVTFE